MPGPTQNALICGAGQVSPALADRLTGVGRSWGATTAAISARPVPALPLRPLLLSSPAPRADPDLIRQVAVKHFAKFHDRPSFVSFPSGWGRAWQSRRGRGRLAWCAAQPPHGFVACATGGLEAVCVRASALLNSVLQHRHTWLPCLMQQEQATGGSALRAASQSWGLLVRTAVAAAPAPHTAQTSQHAVAGCTMLLPVRCRCEQPLAPTSTLQHPCSPAMALAGARCALL